jgi:hypothetical protein
MPTARPRHLITETDDVAAALDIAAALWPDLSRWPVSAGLPGRNARGLAGVIVLDASVVIAALVSQDTQHAAAVKFFRGTTDILLINPVTLAEVLVAPSRKRRSDQVLTELDNLG